ncbi:MAG: hypothetical protein JW974_00145 [Alphaproteobacteria bacterium]|nr:hypothetical protein [Alphaproteobacteria bacterium]MBN2675074.1 hypothetical protein [Alphaproteobacteria bacterium]
MFKDTDYRLDKKISFNIISLTKKGVKPDYGNGINISTSDYFHCIHSCNKNCPVSTGDKYLKICDQGNEICIAFTADGNVQKKLAELNSKNLINPEDFFAKSMLEKMICLGRKRKENKYRHK